MTAPRSTMLATVLACLLTTGVLLAPVAAANAEDPTSIAFDTTGPLEVAYGEDWVAVLQVGASGSDGPLLGPESSDGTVDVFISGSATAFVSGLPIQPDGKVYVTQPETTPFLAPGSYQLTANFVPTPGGFYAPSQTFSPLSLTVSSLTVDGVVRVETGGSETGHPTITAELVGSYVDLTGGAPAGTWTFVVNSGDGESVFESTAAQESGATGPLSVEIDANLAAGTKYSVTSTFTVAAELADGVTVGELKKANFTTPAGTLGELLLSATSLPLWLAIILGVLPLGLASAAVLLVLRLRRGPVTVALDAPPAEADTTKISTDD